MSKRRSKSLNSRYRLEPAKPDTPVPEDHPPIMPAGMPLRKPSSVQFPTLVKQPQSSEANRHTQNPSKSRLPLSLNDSTNTQKPSVQAAATQQILVMWRKLISHLLFTAETALPKRIRQLLSEGPTSGTRPSGLSGRSPRPGLALLC